MKKNAADHSMTPEKAHQMMKIAARRFSYIYPLLARQVVDDFGISKGKALDIGCGSAPWSIELAKITQLHVVAVDLSPSMAEIALQNVKRHGDQANITVVVANVEEMPFESDTFDVIVSRGSFHFWEDKITALRDIYRVLRPNGRTFVGGGDGYLWPRDISGILWKLHFRWVHTSFISSRRGWLRNWLPRADWVCLLREAGITRFTIHPNRLWIDIRK